MNYYNTLYTTLISALLTFSSTYAMIIPTGQSQTTTSSLIKNAIYDIKENQLSILIQKQKGKSPTEFSDELSENANKIIKNISIIEQNAKKCDKNDIAQLKILQRNKLFTKLNVVFRDLKLNSKKLDKSINTINGLIAYSDLGLTLPVTKESIFGIVNRKDLQNDEGKLTDENKEKFALLRHLFTEKEWKNLIKKLEPVHIEWNYHLQKSMLKNKLRNTPPSMTELIKYQEAIEDYLRIPPQESRLILKLNAELKQITAAISRRRESLESPVPKPTLPLVQPESELTQQAPVETQAAPEPALTPVQMQQKIEPAVLPIQVQIQQVITPEPVPTPATQKILQPALPGILLKIQNTLRNFASWLRSWWSW